MKFQVGDIVFWSDPDDNLCSKIGKIESIDGEKIILEDGTECFEKELADRDLRVIHISSGGEYRYGYLENKTIPLPGSSHAFSIVFDGESEARCCFGLVVPENDENLALCLSMTREGKDPFDYFANMFQFVRLFDNLRKTGSSDIRHDHAKMFGW